MSFKVGDRVVYTYEYGPEPSGYGDCNGLVGIVHRVRDNVPWPIYVTFFVHGELKVLPCAEEELTITYEVAHSG